VPVLSEAPHRRATTFHVSIDDELSTHGASGGGSCGRRRRFCTPTLIHAYACELDISEVRFCGTINPPRLRRHGQGGRRALCMSALPRERGV
jgi:hypothetical protein